MIVIPCLDKDDDDDDDDDEVQGLSRDRVFHPVGWPRLNCSLFVFH